MLLFTLEIFKFYEMLPCCFQILITHFLLDKSLFRLVYGMIVITKLILSVYVFTIFHISHCIPQIFLIRPRVDLLLFLFREHRKFQ